MSALPICQCALTPDTKTATTEFLQSRRALGVSRATVAFYAWCLAQIPHGPLPTTLAHVETLLASKADRLAPASLCGLWRGLRAFFRWASSRYGCPDPLAGAKAPRPPSLLPRTLSPESITALLAACRTRRDRTMLLLLLDTGARLGELASLTKDSIGPELVQLIGKTGTRFVPLTPELRYDILLLGATNSNALWSTRRRRPLSPRGVRAALVAVFRRADVDGSPHDLRHTFAYRYLLNGGDVFSLQRLLGHRDVSTTMIYVRLQTADLVTQHRIYSPAKEFIHASARLFC